AQIVARTRTVAHNTHYLLPTPGHPSSGVDGEGAAPTASVLDDDGSVEELLELGGEHARRNIGYAARTKAHNYGDATLWELLGMSVPHLSDDSRRGDRDKQPASTDHDPAPEGDFASHAFTTVGPATSRPIRSASVSKTSSGLTFAMFTSGPKAFTSNLPISETCASETPLIQGPGSSIMTRDMSSAPTTVLIRPVLSRSPSTNSAASTNTSSDPAAKHTPACLIRSAAVDLRSLEP